MKRISLIILAVILLAGCAGFSNMGAKEVMKVEEAIVSLGQSKLTVPCKAGIMAGLTIAPDTNKSVENLVKAMNMLVDPKDPEYIKCYGEALYFSFLIHGASDISDKIISKLTGLGVILP